MEDYAAYIRQQQQAGAAAVRPQRAPTPEEMAGGGALMFGNRESTVERKQRIKGELRKMNGYNSQMSGHANPAAPQRHQAQPISNVAGARPGLPALQKSPVAAPPAPGAQQQLRSKGIPQEPMRRRPPSEPTEQAGPDRAAGVDDARFRALERQCIDLREEQRQILGWLAKSEEAAAAERASREQAEASLRGLLEQTVKAQEIVGEKLGGRITDVYNELSERCQSAEQQHRMQQGVFDRAVSSLTDSISQLSSDLNALSFFVASGGTLGGARVAEIARARGAEQKQ